MFFKKTLICFIVVISLNFVLKSTALAIDFQFQYSLSDIQTLKQDVQTLNNKFENLRTNWTSGYYFSKKKILILSSNVSLLKEKLRVLPRLPAWNIYLPEIQSLQCDIKNILNSDLLKEDQFKDIITRLQDFYSLPRIVFGLNVKLSPLRLQQNRYEKFDISIPNALYFSDKVHRDLISAFYSQSSYNYFKTHLDHLCARVLSFYAEISGEGNDTFNKIRDSQLKQRQTQLLFYQHGIKNFSTAAMALDAYKGIIDKISERDDLDTIQGALTDRLKECQSFEELAEGQDDRNKFYNNLVDHFRPSSTHGNEVIYEIIQRLYQPDEQKQSLETGHS